MEAATTQHNNIVGNVTITVDDEQPEGAKHGKKRGRKEIKSGEERRSKRLKVKASPPDNIVKTLIKRVPKPKAPRQAESKAISSKENSTTFIGPKWKVLQPPKSPETTQPQGQLPLTKLKPRIWTSSREELAVLLPDLAGPKCLNGVSWLMYETPMLLLDESTTCFDISLQEDSVTLDLFTTREFTCTWPQGHEEVLDLPESLAVNIVPEGSYNLGATVTSSNNMLPKTRRTKKSAPTAITNPSRTPPEGLRSGNLFRLYGLETSSDVIAVGAPSVLAYSQGEPPVENVSEPYGVSTKVPSRPFGDVFMGGGRRTKAGSSKETSEAVLIDFSPPSVPSYTTHEPIAGGSSEPLPNAHSNVGNASTKQQREGSSNSVRTWDPNVEQYHFTNALVSNDLPIQIREDGITFPGLHYRDHVIGQTELVKIQSPTYLNSSRSDKRASHCPLPYETKYFVKNDTSHTTLEAMDNLTQATYNLLHSPPPGPGPWMQNASLDVVKSVPPYTAPNNHGAITNNLSHFPEISQTIPSASKCDKPSTQIPTSQISSKVIKAPHSISDLASQTHMGFEKHGISQIEPKSKADSKPKIEGAETVEPSDAALNEAKVEQTRDMKVLKDAFIPSTLPEEIQVIIDSYLSGRPILLIISNKRFFDYWSLRLPKEFGFSMLGYFRILGVQESRVHLNDPVCPLDDSFGLMTGQVKWRFRLRWSPGGEEWILPKHDRNLLNHPWWRPPPPLSIPPLEAPSVSQDISAAENITVSNLESIDDKDRTAPFEPESTFDTTPRYRAARLSNANYKFRHAHLGELYHSHVPLQLLAPYGRTVLDSSFPRGWLCENCGKMNFQAALRHRTCSSSFCKGLKPEIAPYAIELMFMRDPQDNLSMVLPYNEPLLIDLVDTWEDGSRTLPYYIHDDENIFIKHIFTRNLPQLQLEATRLLRLIQLEVKLVRPISENSPYFQYSACAPKDDPSPTTSQWPNVPLCIHHAKDWTQHQAIWFGELKKEQLLINHLCLLAWVTSGTKRGPGIIRAKEKCVVFHAFGCNITVLATPLSSKATAPVKVGGVDLDSLIPMDNLPPDEPDVDPGWIAGLDEEDDAVQEPSQEDKECWPATNLKKASNSNRPFLLTLVHGDVLVFYGDDFEYSLKRTGTSFLLIASHQNETLA